MRIQNILCVNNREEFRMWLNAHSATEKECWVQVKRGKPVEQGAFYYLDAVEEALCFGWIDSTHKLIDGVRMQRFTPRKKNSPWTELNKERVRRLEKLGRMTDAGRAVLPPMGARSFRIDPEIEAAMKQARVWKRFRSFPPLYQRIRAYNVSFYKKRDPAKYEQTLAHLIAETKGEEISTHSSGGDAFVICLDGVGLVTIDGTPFELHTGESIVMPAGHPHAVFGKENFKMLLVVIF